MSQKPPDYWCFACEHQWSLTLDQREALLNMTPVCPECGSMNVGLPVDPEGDH